MSAIENEKQINAIQIAYDRCVNEGQIDYPYFIVTQFQHGDIGERVQTLNFRYFVGAQIQFRQIDQFLQVLDLRQPIETDVQIPAIIENPFGVNDEMFTTECNQNSHSKLVSVSRFSISVI